MAANVDPYRRYRPIRLGIHVCADESGESVTVRNYDLPSPEFARLRFEAARLACLAADDDKPELVVELISGGIILDAFPMRRTALEQLRNIVDPPPPPMPNRYRIDLCASGRLVDGPELELGRADTIPDARRRYDEEVERRPGRLVVLRDSVVTTSFPASVMCRSDGKPHGLVI